MIIFQIITILIQLFIVINMIAHKKIRKKIIDLNKSEIFFNNRFFYSPFKVIFCSIFILFYFKRFIKDQLYEYSLKRIQMYEDLIGIGNLVDKTEYLELKEVVRNYDIRIKLLKIKRKMFINKFKIQNIYRKIFV